MRELATRLFVISKDLWGAGLRNVGARSHKRLNKEVFTLKGCDIPARGETLGED